MLHSGLNGEIPISTISFHQYFPTGKMRIDLRLLIFLLHPRTAFSQFAAGQSGFSKNALSLMLKYSTVIGLAHFSVYRTERYPSRYWSTPLYLNGKFNRILCRTTYFVK